MLAEQESCVRLSPAGRKAGRASRQASPHQAASITSGTSPKPHPDRISGLSRPPTEFPEVSIFIGGTRTGKTHLCIGVASAVIRTRARTLLQPR